MGGKQMNTLLSQFMKDEYTDSKSDLFAAFIERCMGFARPLGKTGMITMQSWMFLSSYEKLRSSMLKHQQISSMIHLGTRAFDSIGGEVVSSTAFVLSNQVERQFRDVDTVKGSFIRLVEGSSEGKKIVALRAALASRGKEFGYHLASSEDFMSIPGSPVVYWLSEKMRAAFRTGRNLSTVAEPRRGLDTGNNERFVRNWWEVSKSRCSMTSKDRTSALDSKARWFPFNKGGEYRKWWGNQELVVNWENDGNEIRDVQQVPGARPQNLRFYFLPTVSWSRITTASPSFRFYPAGSIFSSNGPGLYTESGDSCRIQDAGLLNSNTVVELLNVLAPTMDIQAGQIAQLPLADVTDPGLEGLVELLARTSKYDSDVFEVSWEYARNPLVALLCS